MKSEDKLLREQIEYYRARAPEYDDWFYRRDRYDRGEEHRAHWVREIEVIRSSLRASRPTGSVLEIACGTGIWTALLAEHARNLHVIDAAPEALAICRERVERPDLVMTCTDIFEWTPSRRYDFVFFSFWLSHVPPARFAAFWSIVRDALAPAGSVFFVDSALHAEYPKVDQRRRGDDEWRARRDLRDGREYDIVKIFYDARALSERLVALGWTGQVQTTETFFLFGNVSPTLATRWRRPID